MPQATKPRNPHNKAGKQSKQQQALQELLRPGQSIELLKELHILTRDGAINQDSRRKLKQVYHLFGFIEPLLLELEKQNPEASHVTLADHGAGKSYLGFIIHDLFFQQTHNANPQSNGTRNGTIYGIETRPELVEKSTALAQKLGFTHMQFLAIASREAVHTSALPESIDIVTALHACDTATDEAIDFGLQKRAKHMVLVPCCQAEAATHLRQSKALQLARTPLAELWRHPIHTREVGSHITNVMRCLYLEAQGYRVTVTELVGWEHSMKNELIIAGYNGQKKRSSAQRMHALAESFGLEEWLHKRFPRLNTATENTASN